MLPHFPNETITAIFECLYKSLCINPTQAEPDFPTGASLIFSQFSLVSKRFHSLALPFLVRHFDSNNVESFTKFIKKYDLASSVKSFYLNPELFGYKDPEPLEIWPKGAKFLMGYQSRAMREDAMEKVENMHQEARETELSRWKPLLKLCMRHLTSIEIGSRRKNPFEVGPHVGKWHRTSIEDFDDCENFSTNTAAALELGYYLDTLPISPNVTTVRFNVPSEPTSMYEYDEQSSRQIAKLFPNVQHFTLHLHNEHNLTERYDGNKKPWTFPSLVSLRILNARCALDGFSGNILPILLTPSANTLRHFEIQTSSKLPVMHELFGKLTFPHLETLIIDNPQSASPAFDFSERFPVIASVSLPIEAAASTAVNLSDLPSTLQDLTLTRITNEDVDSATKLLQHGLQTGNLQNLRRYILKGTLTPDHDSLLSGLTTICDKRGIELGYEVVIQEEIVERRANVESDDTEDEVSEDERYRDEDSEERYRDEDSDYDSEDEDREEDYSFSLSRIRQ